MIAAFRTVMGMELTPKHRLARRAATTLAAWLAAYGIVSLVTTAGGDWLAAAPAALRTLVMSGVLVITMVNLLMPTIGKLITRLFP
jgi:antibiotic biosynthesis monooxygenase (ABM) superfamily enzyme